MSYGIGNGVSKCAFFKIKSVLSIESLRWLDGLSYISCYIRRSFLFFIFGKV